MHMRNLFRPLVDSINPFVLTSSTLFLMEVAGTGCMHEPNSGGVARLWPVMQQSRGASLRISQTQANNLRSAGRQSATNHNSLVLFSDPAGTQSEDEYALAQRKRAQRDAYRRERAVLDKEVADLSQRDQKVVHALLKAAYRSMDTTESHHTRNELVLSFLQQQLDAEMRAEYRARVETAGPNGYESAWSRVPPKYHLSAQSDEVHVFTTKARLHIKMRPGEFVAYAYRQYSRHSDPMWRFRRDTITMAIASFATGIVARGYYAARVKYSTRIGGITPQQATKLRSLLKKIPGAKKVMAYGSRTEGTWTSKSDLDIVVFGKINEQSPATLRAVRKAQDYAQEIGIGMGKTGRRPLDIH